MKILSALRTMPDHGRILCFCLMILFLSWLPIAESASDSGVASRTKITISYVVGSHPPFYMGEGTTVNLEKPGTTVELLQLVARKLNMDLHFKRVPWRRCQLLLSTNEVDGIFHASFKEDRLKMGGYPMKDAKPDPDRRITNMAYYFYTLRNSPFKWDGEKFENLNGPICATGGSAIIDTLKGKGVILEESKQAPQCIMKLLKGRVAVYAELGYIADAKLAASPKESQDMVKKIPAPIRSKPYYLMLSHGFIKKNPDLAERIWDEIGKIRESQAFEEIMKKY